MQASQVDDGSDAEASARAGAVTGTRSDGDRRRSSRARGRPATGGLTD